MAGYLVKFLQVVHSYRNLHKTEHSALTYCLTSHNQIHTRHKHLANLLLHALANLLLHALANLLLHALANLLLHALDNLLLHVLANMLLHALANLLLHVLANLLLHALANLLLHVLANLLLHALANLLLHALANLLLHALANLLLHALANLLLHAFNYSLHLSVVSYTWTYMVILSITVQFCQGALLARVKGVAPWHIERTETKEHLKREKEFFWLKSHCHNGLTCYKRKETRLYPFRPQLLWHLYHLKSYTPILCRFQNVECLCNHLLVCDQLVVVNMGSVFFFFR